MTRVTLRGGWKLLRGLAVLPASEWWELACAQIALLQAQVLLCVRPTGSLVDDHSRPERADRSGIEVSAFRVSPPPPDAAFRAARAVRRAAQYGVFRPRCLVRSVALHRLLERRGVVGSRIRVGVRREQGRFEAHAWVELDGRVLGDTPSHTSGFTRLLDVRPARVSR